MRKLLFTAMVLALSVTSARAQYVSPASGGGVAGTGVNGQCATWTSSGVIGASGASCGTGAGYPTGAPPQLTGYSASNVAESETVTGDATLTRAGANSYTIAVTKTGGTAFGALATLGVGTGLTSSGGNLNLTVPVTTANGGSGVVSPTAHSMLQSEGLSAFSTIPAATAGHLVIDQGAGADWASQALSGAGDLGTTTLSGAGVLNAQVTNLSHVTNGSLASSGLANTAVAAGSYTNTNLTVNAEGQITAASNGAGPGNPIIVHTQTAGTTGTMTVNSTTAVTDVFYMTPTGNLTETTDTAAHMGDGEEVILRSHNAGTADTVTFSAGTGVTLKSIVPGDTGSVGAVCVPPTTGDTWYRFQWDLALGNLTLMGCGPQPPAVIAIAQGGTGVNAVSGWPISTNVSTSVSGATNLTPSASFWNTNQDVTMTASATLTMVVPSFANQTETVKVCQNGTGGFTPTFAAGGGLTVTGTFPTCTTTASKCCDFELYFDSASTAYVTGFNNGPL